MIMFPCSPDHYVGVSHVLVAVGVPAFEAEAGAGKAAQEAESQQSVHGNKFMFYRSVFVSVGALPVGNC